MADPASNSPVAYLREVRRARARFAKDPAALGQRLRQLNHARDLEAPSLPIPRSRPDVSPRVRSSRAADQRSGTAPFPAKPPPATRRPDPPPVQHVDVRRRTPAETAQVVQASVVAPQPQPAVPFTPVDRSPSHRPGVLGVPRDVADAFVLEVEAAIEGGLLRYTARRRLVARAGRLGIGTFDANLLIASVLHHEARHPPTTASQPQAGGIGRWIVAVLVVEAVAVVAWYALR